MSYYAEHFNEIYNAHKAIMQENEKAGQEIAVVLNYLQGRYFLNGWNHSAIAVIGDKNDENREVVYDDLEAETIGFMQEYFPEVALTKVDDAEKWIKEHIRFGRN